VRKVNGCPGRRAGAIAAHEVACAASVTREFAIWVSLVVIGAACVVLHVSLLFRALRARELPRALRWSALLPPVTPIAAWHAGARIRTLVWGACGLSYLALRMLARASG